jgi:hypothetical protein
MLLLRGLLQIGHVPDARAARKNCGNGQAGDLPSHGQCAGFRAEM